jgi:hypothetical protein
MPGSLSYVFSNSLTTNKLLFGLIVVYREDISVVAR